MRKCGVFINISSLPSEYAIGGMGKEINNLTDKLAAANVKIWQILPITAIGQGNSPYSGESAFAGNFLYIDPLALYADGYIDKPTLEQSIYHRAPFTVDYDYARKSKSMLIKSAQAHKSLFADKLAVFVKNNSDWLVDYALFMAIKLANGGKAWWDWSNELACHSGVAIAEFSQANADIIEYYYIEQFLFDVQWRAAKGYVNAKRIEVMGDMPIYVSRDSVDVWANREQFLLNDEYLPTVVAGVPPDYFAARGQLWGNPIYNYAVMADNNYDWFSRRMKRMFELYDICRFDHFRAVSEYWSVKYGSADAVDGEWVTGGGAALLSSITAGNYGEIIAEDLGVINDDVIALRKQFDMKGMRVMQFGFDGDDSLHTPHNYARDIVAYTGTHDNNTLFGWLYELTLPQRANLLDYIGAKHGLEGGQNSEQVWGCIRAVLTSVADYAIVPFQDLAGWGADTRLNVPGVAEGNWRIRVVEDNINEIDWARLCRLIMLSKRD